MARDHPRPGAADLELRRLRRAVAVPGPAEELRAEFADAPVSLALYRGVQLVRATADLTWAPAGTLHRRFLGWLR